MKKILVIFFLLYNLIGQSQADSTNIITKQGDISYRDALAYLLDKVNTTTTINRVKLTVDVINNNAVANTLQDVTGLSFPVVSGVTYWFKFYIIYTSAATTTGSRWSLNGPAFTTLNYFSNYTLTATSITNNQGLNGYNLPAASNASSLTASNTAVIEGTITPSANGNVIARFASEITNSSITAKQNSFVLYQIIN